MNNPNRKSTFNVDAIMTNAHDGYRQAQADKDKIHQLNCMLDEAYKVRNRLRQQIIDLETELATVQEQRLTDSQQFIITLLKTVLIMIVLLIIAVSF